MTRLALALTLAVGLAGCAGFADRLARLDSDSVAAIGREVGKSVGGPTGLGSEGGGALGGLLGYLLALGLNTAGRAMGGRKAAQALKSPS